VQFRGILARHCLGIDGALLPLSSAITKGDTMCTRGLDAGRAALMRCLPG
jgi:hypothetical protein